MTNEELQAACAFSGCDKPRRVLGLCPAHYLQRRRGGALRPLTKNRAEQLSRARLARWGRRTIEQRIADMTTPLADEPGCWLWIGATDRRGYAQIRINGRTRYVARVVLDIVESPALQALHRCDNGPLGCVNPAHLFAGTAKDNVHDMMRKGRGGGQFKRRTA